jgi:HSP20 family molecular chaperone IbpA
MSNTLSIIRTPVTSASYSRLPSLLGRGVFDDFFDSFFQDFGSLQRRSTQGYPVADIFTDDDGNTVMEFALAGFSKKDLQVDVKPEKQTITVAANVEGGDNSGRRIARRAFQKTFVNYDSNLDLASASAFFENGLLRITVPQRPEVQPVTIKIK